MTRRRGRPSRARNNAIFDAWIAGASYAQLATIHGVSRTRIYQIVKRFSQLRTQAVRVTGDLETQRRREVEALAALVEERRRLNDRIRSTRLRLAILDEEIQSRQIDRLLGLAG